MNISTMGMATHDRFVLDMYLHSWPRHLSKGDDDVLKLLD